MEQLNLELMAFLAAAGFVAAFIDSVVGGGGLVSLPAILLTGLPPSMALGTNKMASVMGSLTSTVSFMRSGKVDYKIMRYLFPLSLAGSALGVYTVRQIPSEFLRPLVVVLLVLVTVYTIFKKEWGKESTYTGMTTKMAWLSGLVSFIIGFYDGFFGPGAGSFFLFGFLLIGFDFLSAAGNARALNFASNMAAVISFGCTGLINFYYGIPMGLFMIAGAMLGSRLAIAKGSAYVRPLFISVSSLLIGKQIWDLLK